RIGRTGRAGKKGMAITLVTPLEYKELLRMQKEIDSEIELFEIPTINENQIIKTLHDAKVSEGIISLYEQLTEIFEPSQLVLKLLSLQFETSKIGLNQQEIDAIQNPKEKTPKLSNKKTHQHEPARSFKKGHYREKGSKTNHHSKKPKRR
ncbi:ATP-dependent RNA helicase, partial [Helicobacter pylori NCTC 11637 = CCUG 17874 = ATCC 43504 = JCM 12093]